MGRPWSFLPNWATGCKPAPGRDPGGHGYWVPYNPVEYAFRTVGLVRGKHPYAMIVDDVKKDNARHRYAWLMQAPDDLEVVGRSVGTPGKDGILDLVLGEKEGDRKLLVRVLAAGSETLEAKLTQTEATLETFQKEHRRNITTHKRISLPLEAVIGTYKVLLFPFHSDDKLPETIWSDGGKTLAVRWPDHRDVFEFSAGKDGRTRITLTRDGQETVRLP
jgi:hypothetical protein